MTAPSPSRRLTASPPHSPARIALLGCGTVGREVARRLLAEGDRLGVELVRILVRDTSRDRGVPRELPTGDFEDILAGDPALVIEAIGGLEPAADVRACLERGLPVVTANKTLIAHQGGELHALADRAGAGLAYEATVCAGVPVIAAIRQLAPDGITAIRGVVNGTCNFVLTRLGEGRSLDEAVAEARARGLAEPDPSTDLCGRDSAEKLCVLAAAAGFEGITPQRVSVEGIEHVTAADVRDARRRAEEIRLVAELEVSGGGVSLRVGPTLVPRGNALAAVRDEENAVVISTPGAGDIVLRGKGAGPAPTAAAIIGDVARVLALAPAAARSPAAAVPPARAHAIRVRSRASPDGLLDALTRHGVTAHELEIGPADTRIRTAEAAPSAVASCAREAGGEPGGFLVMPRLHAAVA
jgi:homoserine dehydrogenase